ncbi:hypothetical protein ACF0H5_012011 [Mactra antiquata]
MLLVGPVEYLPTMSAGLTVLAVSALCMLFTSSITLNYELIANSLNAFLNTDFKYIRFFRYGSLFKTNPLKTKFSMRMKSIFSILKFYNLRARLESSSGIFSVYASLNI